MDDVNISIKSAAIKDQLNSLELALSEDESTFLILVATHVDPTRNSINKINCKQGVPIRGYVYDAKADAYFYDCYDYIQVGNIPVSMRLSMRHTGWATKIPLAEDVILQFLNERQLRDVNHFKSLFSPDEYSLEFLQLIGVE
jgi:hypothetical protein